MYIMLMPSPSQPFFVQRAVRIHEVALTSILYEAVLHSVVLIIISAARTVYEAVATIRLE